MGEPNEEVDNSLFPAGGASLEDQEALWSQGQEESARSRPVGTFQAVIESATYGPSVSSGRFQITYELKILTGEYKDVKLMKYDGLGSPKSASITQGQLKRLGIDTSKITVKTLPAHLLALKGKHVQIQCKVNGDFHNTLFQKILTEAVGGDAKAGAPARPGQSPKRPSARKF